MFSIDCCCFGYRLLTNVQSQIRREVTLKDVGPDHVSPLEKRLPSAGPMIWAKPVKFGVKSGTAAIELAFHGDSRGD